MAKPPPIVRCKIVCTKIVEISDVGPTMLKLSELGFDEIGTDFVSDDPKFTRRTNYEVNGENFLMAWTVDHPTFLIKEAIAHFRENGRSHHSCYGAARTLVDKKLLKSPSPGHYARADVKALTAPKKKVRGANTKGKSNSDIYDPPHPVFAMRAISRNHGRATRAWLKEQFIKAKRPAKSAPPVLAFLVKKKKLKRVSEGVYELMKETEQKPAAVKINGSNGAEAAHGN